MQVNFLVLVFLYIRNHLHKQAPELLLEKVGLYFNATDLANQIPKTMNKVLSF